MICLRSVVKEFNNPETKLIDAAKVASGFFVYSRLGVVVEKFNDFNKFSSIQNRVYLILYLVQD